MAAFSTLRSELVTSLSTIPVGGFDSLELTYFASQYAERLIPHMNELSEVGDDFLYGRSRVNYLRNHTWAEYNLAAAHTGFEHLDGLCCSAGAINIGIYGNKLVLKHAWQGLELSDHQCYVDSAIIMHPSNLNINGRLYDTAADLMLLLANMSHVLRIPQQTVRQWALVNVRRASLNTASWFYPNTVPVGAVSWFLSEQDEQLLEQAAVTEMLDHQAASDVVRLHNLITEYMYAPMDSAPSLSYTPCCSPSFMEWGSDVESVA